MAKRRADDLAGVDPNGVHVPREVAVRIEEIEARSAHSAHTAAPETVAAALRLGSEKIGSARICVTGRSQSLWLNRTVGLGLRSPATEAHLDRIEEAFRTRGARRYSVALSPLARPASLEGWLRARGLRRTTGSSKLWRDGRPAGPPPPTGLDVREAGPEDAETWWDVLSTIWPRFRTRREWITARIGRPGWRHYLAWAGKRPAACAALYVDDGAAHLLEGATLAAFRRRGAQAALIHRRVVDGLADGARIFTSETAPALPRQPLVSFRNLRRGGFALAYIRPSWRREDRGTGERPDGDSHVRDTRDVPRARRSVAPEARGRAQPDARAAVGDR